VPKFRCDGTPRHACTDTSTVSTTHAAVNSASHDIRARTRSSEVTQVTVARVVPNDRPNVAALRSEVGPVQDPPVVSRIATCTSPPTTSIAATT